MIHLATETSFDVFEFFNVVRITAEGLLCDKSLDSTPSLFTVTDFA